MFQTGVHEHIGYDLIYSKITGQKEMQAQKVFQVNSVQTGNVCGSKSQHIYYKQVFGYRGHCIHKMGKLYVIGCKGNQF
jgi:hypothetical protein